MADWKTLTISELELSTRTYHALRNGGLISVQQILAASETDLMWLENFGRKSLNELNEVLANLGAPTPSRIANIREQRKYLEKHISELQKRIDEANKSIDRIDAELAGT